MKFKFLCLLGIVLTGQTFSQNTQTFHHKKETDPKNPKIIDKNEELKYEPSNHFTFEKNGTKFLTNDTIEALIGCGIFAVTTAGAVYLGPALLGLKEVGIAEGSVMSVIQSSYGNIAADSWFAAVQSWTYKSGGAALINTSVISGALSGSSCLILFSKFWEHLPAKYLNHEAIEIYKEFAVKVAKETKKDIDHKLVDLENFFDMAWNKMRGGAISGKNFYSSRILVFSSFIAIFGYIF